MSPRHAAPSTASVEAWQITSASEWPSAPRSNGTDPAEHQAAALDEPVQVVSGADTSAKLARRPGRAAPRPLQVVSRRGSSRCREHGHDVHHVAGLLGERGLIGRRLRTARARPLPQMSRRKACGVCARKIDSRGSVSTTRAPDEPVCARFTVSRTGCATIAAPHSGRGVDRLRDQIRGHERPGRA